MGPFYVINQIDLSRRLWELLGILIFNELDFPQEMCPINVFSRNLTFEFGDTFQGQCNSIHFSLF